MRTRDRSDPGLRRPRRRGWRALCASVGLVAGATAPVPASAVPTSGWFLPIGRYGGFTGESRAFALSADGQVAVGWKGNPGAGSREAFRFTTSGGFQNLG